MNHIDCYATDLPKAFLTMRVTAIDEVVFTSITVFSLD